MRAMMTRADVSKDQGPKVGSAEGDILLGEKTTQPHQFKFIAPQPPL